MKRVLIAEYSRLMYQILRQALNKNENLTVVDLMPSRNELVETILRQEIDLLILPMENSLRKWKMQYRDLLNRFPNLFILGISQDANQVKLYRIQGKSELLPVVNLKNLVDFLEQNLEGNVSWVSESEHDK